MRGNHPLSDPDERDALILRLAGRNTPTHLRRMSGIATRNAVFHFRKDAKQYTYWFDLIDVYAQAAMIASRSRK